MYRGLSPWKLCWLWLVDIVLPMRLQTPPTALVLSLTPPLGTPHSVQRLAVRICLCICKALAWPLRRQPYEAPFSKHFLAATTVLGFDDCIWDGSPDGTVSGWPFLQFLLYTLISYLFLWVFCSPSQKKHPHFGLPSWTSCGLWIISWVLGALGLISTYQRVHTMCALLWLGYLTQDDIF